MQRQRGYALLILLLAASVGAAGLLLSARDPAARERSTRPAQASAALARAHDALLAYALADGYRNPDDPPSPSNIRPGSLPCPDNDGNFSADLFAGNDCPAYVGRLPHRTLDVPRVRDHEGEPLWYALDPGFRDHDDAEPINIGTPGNLTINGTGAYVAVILAPGAPLAGQSRVDSAGAANYLEVANTDGDIDFADCREDAACNDRARGITVEQLLALVPQRLVGTLEKAVTSFVEDHNYHPWAAQLGDPDGACDTHTTRGTFPVTDGDCVSPGSFDARESAGGPIPDWIIDNDWYRYVYYAVADSCAGGANCGSDTLSLNGMGGRSVVIAYAGPPIVSTAKNTMQDRAGAVPQDVVEYLDSPENTDGDNDFDDPEDGAGENDRLRAIAAP